MNLKKAYPNSEIILTTKQQYLPLIKYYKDLDECIPFPEDGKLSSFFRYIKEIRKTKFDLVIDLHNSLRSRIVRKLCKTLSVSIYDSNRNRRKSYLKPGIKYPPFEHTVEMYNDALCLPSSDTLSVKPEFLTKKINQNNKYNAICIITSAKHPTKEWLPEYTLEVIDQLIKQSLNIILVADRNDEMIMPVFSDSPNVEFHVKPDLDTLVELIRRCKAVISGDTGPMHFAEALDAPVIAIFGPTHPCLGFNPLGEYDISLTSNEECSPCSLHGEKECYKDKRYCMININPKLVVEAVGNIISKKGP
ncbi:MAG: glycosyltransferase family 9 protein [candidate division Zixibacteria bacterium]|nr:glycosyltransferase family 9 protein [candidate division Zixibacteria bacterium]